MDYKKRLKDALDKDKSTYDKRKKLTQHLKKCKIELDKAERNLLDYDNDRPHYVVSEYGKVCQDIRDELEEQS